MKTTFDHNLSSTMKTHSRVSVILTISGILLIKLASSRCSKDTDCITPKEMCCRKDFTCKTIPQCQISAQMCMVDSNCPAGKQCIHSICKDRTDATKLPSNCNSDQDCSKYGHMSKCCDRVCKSKVWCAISTTKAPLDRTRTISCQSWRDCASGDSCEGGNCEHNSNALLTKAGFLSAAILTGSVFLLLLCCCFVREGRYSRQRYAERRRRSRNRRRSRQRRRRSSHHTTAVANTAFRTEDSPECEGGFFIPPPEYPRDLTSPVGTDTLQLGEQSFSPPPYSTLSFELPPSYEEVIQTGQRTDALAEVA